VETSLYTVLADRAAGAYVDGPGPPVSALVTTTAYPVATPLLTGALTPADYTAPATSDPRRWALADRVRLVHDPEMSSALLGSTAPFGAALRRAGDRGRVWLREFGGESLAALAQPTGPPVRSFARASKVTPARVVVLLADGTRHEHRVDIPVGAAGPATRAGHGRLVRAKFLGTGGPAEVADAVRLLDRLSAAEVRRLIEASLATVEGA
jgi:2-methylcitrate dehydratase PrpD